MAKGVSKIYLPEQLTKGAMFISHSQTKTERSGREVKNVAEVFEILLPEEGLVELTCEYPNNISVRPKAKTKIKLIDPYITFSYVVKGQEGNKNARVQYQLHAHGFEIEGGVK